MRLTNTEPKADIDLTQIFLDLQDKNRSVFIDQIDGEIFMYKPIGRKDWRDISTSDVDKFTKEEMVCSACILYPEKYDFNECSAGIPSALCNKILDVSCVKYEDIINLISYYRVESNTINSFITCTINEAYPNYDIEDIENWDTDKTIKYFAEAERKLALYHNISVPDIITMLEDEKREYDKAEQEQSNPDSNVNTGEIIDSNNNISQERLNELKAKFPEIDWAHPNIETF